MPLEGGGWDLNLPSSGLSYPTKKGTVLPSPLLDFEFRKNVISLG